MKRNEPVASLKATLAERLENHLELVFALLYGSAMEGSAFHDLDVGTYVDRTLIAPSNDLDCMPALSEELSHDMLYQVDVRVINDAPLTFRYNVSRGQELIVNDFEALARFRESVWDEYLDFQPIALQYLRDMR